MILKQATLNGTIEDGDDFDGYKAIDEFKKVLDQLNWVTDKITPGRDGYYLIEISNGAEHFKLHTYLKKVGWRHRKDYEKGIQFGENHVTEGFDAQQTETEKSIVIGLYKRNIYNETLICAWDPFEWGTRGKPFNCFVNVEALANAFKYGFVRDTTRPKKVFVFKPEFFFYYLKNKTGIHEIDHANSSSANSITSSVFDLPRNKIIAGAPGTGKSYYLRKEAAKALFKEQCTVRITFYPSYTYQQFVGSYKPTPIYRSLPSGSTAPLYEGDRMTLATAPRDKEPLIDYSYIAGPLLKLLIEAWNNPNENYLLIIEEINRANAASVFGDIFQLLDRDSTGASEYDIDVSHDLGAFLKSIGITSTKIKLPSNLYIWATMNSADQGVISLDAAFKRRWEFEYLLLDQNADEVSSETVTFQKRLYDWNLFREAINNKLKTLEVAEDKLIAPFFLSKSEMKNENSIKNKLLLYLRDDIVRHNPLDLFVHATFSDIIHSYNNFQPVFSDLILPEPFAVDLVEEEGTTENVSASQIGETNEEKDEDVNTLRTPYSVSDEVQVAAEPTLNENLNSASEPSDDEEIEPGK